MDEATRVVWRSQVKVVATRPAMSNSLAQTRKRTMDSSSSGSLEMPVSTNTRGLMSGSQRTYAASGAAVSPTKNSSRSEPEGFMRKAATGCSWEGTGFFETFAREVAQPAEADRARPSGRGGQWAGPACGAGPG